MSTDQTHLNALLSVIAPSKPINLFVRIVSSPREHQYSYTIGTLSVASDLSWLELERSCIKIFVDHITQVDSPFDYMKSSIGCTTNHIDTLTLGILDIWSDIFLLIFLLTIGLTKWHYQDSPNDGPSMPYTAARQQDSITIHLKGIDTNATDSLAYNYFIPSQNLKNFIRYVCFLSPCKRILILFFRSNKILMSACMVQHIFRRNLCSKIWWDILNDPRHSPRVRNSK